MKIRQLSLTYYSRGQSVNSHCQIINFNWVNIQRHTITRIRGTLSRTNWDVNLNRANTGRHILDHSDRHRLGRRWPKIRRGKRSGLERTRRGRHHYPLGVNRTHLARLRILKVRAKNVKDEWWWTTIYRRWNTINSEMPLCSEPLDFFISNCPYLLVRFRT